MKMPRHKTGPPEGATIITKYAQFEELIKSFVKGFITLLTLVGHPGLCKSQCVRRAIRNEKCLYVKGRKSPIDLYCDLYARQDCPVVSDDSGDLLSVQRCLEYLMILTETDRHKVLPWGTSTKLLKARGVPKQFYTTSTVCIITNRWGTGPIYDALESRGEFVYFDPDWNELYKQCGGWFWDQEIFDYVRERMQNLKQPDARLLVKAAARKAAGMKTLPWKKLIDDYQDDKIGMTVRELIADDSYPNEAAREEVFTACTGADRSTYYRRKKDIARFQPKKLPARIILKRTERPVEKRPADGAIDDGAG